VATTVVFYDGVCGLCNRLVRFVVRRDHRRQFVFAPLQGRLARTTLPPHGYDPAKLDTMYVIADWHGPTEHVLVRSRTILHTLLQLASCPMPPPEWRDRFLE
jgi:predicted DCC family thiol-disulfide oxidoreductase YuxK